ncbi:MAG: phosphotransferase, partial [Candidatus Altiarchaeales archaeon HGW-Altiarchaeales-3]
MKFDLHIHSKYSYDSFSDPLEIVKAAKRKGVDVISITDHDNMNAYKNFTNKSEIIIIPGMEVKTNLGDIIGLFLNTELKSRNFFEVIDEIREQDGVIVLPHPYRRKCNPEEIVGYVDLVEVINSRSNDMENTYAEKLCGMSNKKPITGSDAHACFEIGSAITEMNEYSNDLDK